MYPHDAHCPTDPSSPRPVGWCDRCYRKWYLDALSFQWDYRGNALKNLRIRVCPECLDRPQEQLRPVFVGPDPAPLKDPRPNFYSQQMGVSNQLTSDQGNPLTTDGGAALIPD
jgi:hypothetical protein